MLNLKRINRTALAKEIGFTKPGISQILTGRRETSISTAYAIAQATGIRVDYLIEALLFEKAKRLKRQGLLPIERGEEDNEDNLR